MSSIRKQLGAIISGGQETSLSSEALKRAGLTLMSSERLSERKREQQLFNSKLETKAPAGSSADAEFEFYVKVSEDCWKMYKENQMAWYRAGTSGPFSKMVSCIETMKEQFDIAVDSNRNVLAEFNRQVDEAKTKKDTNAVTKIENQKKHQVRNFYNAWWLKCLRKYLYKQGNLCWLTQDVDTPDTFVIQSNQPIQQQYPQTTNEHPKDYTPPNKPTQNWGPPKYETTEKDKQ